MKNKRLVIKSIKDFVDTYHGDLLIVECVESSIDNNLLMIIIHRIADMTAAKSAQLCRIIKELRIFIKNIDTELRLAELQIWKGSNVQ